MLCVSWMPICQKPIFPGGISGAQTDISQRRNLHVPDQVDKTFVKNPTILSNMMHSYRKTRKPSSSTLYKQ